MIVRTALAGDLHTNVARRAEEARRIAYFIVDDAVARGAHFLGIGGDVIDGPMTEKDRAWLIEFSDYCGERMPTFFLMGNHEPALSLRCLRGRSTKYPVIVEEGAAVHVVETAAGKLAVAAVAYPHKAQLLAHVGPVSSEEADRIAGQALQDIFRGLGVQVEQLGLPTVGLVHGTIKGSKISDDQPDRPLGLDIDIADLALMNCDFICAPHIHKANEFSWGGKVLAATPTSPLYCDYGEAAQFKGYILAEFNSAEPEKFVARIKSVAWQRVPTPAVPMLLLNGRFSDGKIEMDYPHDGDGLEQIPDPVGADIRLRVSFNADQRTAAKRTAAEMEAKLLQFGAVNVTLEPLLVPTTRSRIPQLATTPRLEDKWLLYCQAIGLDLPSERKSVLLECLRLLQEEAAALGLAMGTTGRAAPTLKKVQWKGFLKYPNLVEINFDELAGPLTTIVAPNEAGKSLAMQLIGPGLLYGDTSDRGSLDDLSTATDSFVRGVFDMGGDEYDLTQNANGKDRKGSVSLLKNKQPELSKAGRREYAEWSSKNLLPRNVYDAIICQSGTESIIDMKDGPRVELLLRVLGLEIYEALAESARKKASAVAADLSSVRSRIEEIGTVDLSTLSLEVDTNEKRTSTAQSQLEIVERELNQERAQAQQVEKQRVEYNALVSRRNDLAGQVSRLRTRVTELTTKIDVNKEVVDQAGVIEAAVVEESRLGHDLAASLTIDQDLRLRYAQHSSDRAALETRRNDMARRLNQSQSRVDDLTTRLRAVEAKIEEDQRLIAEADTIRSAYVEVSNLSADLDNKQELDRDLRISLAQTESQLDGFRRQYAENERHQLSRRNQIADAETLIANRPYVEQCIADALAEQLHLDELLAEKQRRHDALSALRAKQLNSRSDRIVGLRSGHDAVLASQSLGLAHKASTAAKVNDSAAAEVESSLPSLIASAEKGLMDLEYITIPDVRAGLEKTRKEAERISQIEEAERLKQEVESELAQVESAMVSLRQSMTSHSEALERLSGDLERVQREAKAVSAQIEALRPLADKEVELATAETRLQGFGEQRTSITADLNAATASVSELSSEIVSLGGEINVQTDALQRIEDEQAVNDSVVESLNNQMALVKSLAAKAPLLNDARARIEELTHQKSGLDSELETLEHEHDKVERQVDGTTLPELIDLAPFEAAVTSARQSLTDYQTRLALAQKELADAEAKEGRRQELTSQVRGLEEQVSNWTMLGQHLGKNALQKAEIDASAAQLTDLTNDMLRAGGDTRHTVTGIETERLHSNKKQMVPCLNINIYDSEEAITKESQLLSEGGKQLVGTPMGLGIVALACQRAGLRAPTILLDEVGNNLDAENAPRFIGSLRRFAEILSARVIFISQSPPIWDLADSRVKILPGGKVVVE